VFITGFKELLLTLTLNPLRTYTTQKLWKFGYI